ncbi:sulfite exporter TauE/SafE family protein [Fimbriimonas ginsengisoli]|uniref:Probable membrane transporter protein n=1 Tax=Fimbriimonas ginsengisoli Gsoil 348 TaxID=661478 RepID=A0A068NZ36_FIMGI|nr:sulfite exporter TauE/SafE family protein [Fimbriimonas ginsengisoli]AIE87889.1 hypothetical protein OP10G_4521 [Fimbriimonas ginsengisoli Gsoil 348]
MPLTTQQYVEGALAALIFGFSKTGVPGSGILAIPIMGAVFGGRLSVGATLPMLIFADCFAVAFYRGDTDWTRLRQLAPWVVGGLICGTVFLKVVGEHPTWKDPMNPMIGLIVLAMVGITLLRKRLGDRLLPHSKSGTRVTGVVAGFSTMVANAAGPIMQIYLIATGMAKERMMGTTALYFFIFNLSKVPFLLWLTWDNPSNPIITVPTFQFNLLMFPVIIVGALLGKRLLPIIPQKAFNDVVMVLTVVAALRLVFF